MKRERGSVTGGEGGGARNRSNPDEDVVSGTEPRFSINHMATQ